MVPAAARIRAVTIGAAAWAGEDRKRLQRADPVHLYAVELRPRRRAGPAAAEEVDLMPLLRETPEDFMQVDLGATGLWIVAVLPVHEQDPHTTSSPSRPILRASASRTPLTNFALRMPE